MIEFSSSELKNNLGTVFDQAQRGPVMIRRRGRPAFVIIEAGEYDRMREAEDARWIAMAKDAEGRGYLTAEESLATLRLGLEDESAQ